MTDPADFLRRHPEIAQTFLDSLRPSLNGYIPTEEHHRALAAVLPAILAAHEADLASRVIGDMEISKIASRFAAAEQDADKKRGPAMWAQAMEKLRETCAAAYLAGRRAGREEAAKVADAEMLKRTQWANSGNPDYGDPMIQTHKAVTASTIARAIRSLP